MEDLFFFLLDDLSVVMKAVKCQALLLAKGQRRTQGSSVSAGQKLLASKGAQWPLPLP